MGGIGIEHFKSDIFSEAHHWCQEVYAAWKAAGKEDNIPLIAKCSVSGKWAVGFGGKKNAERACKLALATVLARDGDANRTMRVIKMYPAFGQYLKSVGCWHASFAGASSLPDKKDPDTPEHVDLELAPDSKLVLEGYPAWGVGIEHIKCDIMSEAHYWCQEFYESPIKDVVAMEQDHDGKMHPEVYAAWKAAGQKDNIALVAKCSVYSKWAVGFGGKKNAERACKLALATVLARDGDPSKTAQVLANYPRFGEYLQTVGVTVPGM